MRSAISILLVLLWISLRSYAQNRSVSGKVNAKGDGSPLSGVNVLLKGTSVGTVTDNEGNFKLNAPTPSAVFVFSFIGFKTQEVTIGNRTTVDVMLSVDAMELSKVVVSGWPPR
jgi:TonB-dependent starch-binding outer membrane protein SusC